MTMGASREDVKGENLHVFDPNFDGLLDDILLGQGTLVWLALERGKETICLFDIIRDPVRS